MKKVEIYTTQWCPYCHAAKSLLDEKGVSYEEVDADDPDVEAVLTTVLAACAGFITEYAYMVAKKWGWRT